MPQEVLLALTQALAEASASSGGTAAVVAGGMIALVKLADHFGEKRRERARDTKLEAAVTAISDKVDESQRATDKRCESIERSVATLSAHIIGPDGENGLRGDLREVKKRVIGLEERERERLSRRVGAKDRRSEV